MVVPVVDEGTILTVATFLRRRCIARVAGYFLFATSDKPIFENASRPSIMLLIGDSVIADLTAFRLELLGYETSRPASTADAMAAITRRSPSLLLLDTMLGDEDGLAFLAKVRRDYAESQLPVLIVTLDPSLDTVRMAHQSGAQDYLISPFDPTVLEAKVNRLLAGDHVSGTAKGLMEAGHATLG